MRRFIRNIIYGVSNLVYWFPIIWRDRDWDQWFIFVALRHKLIRVEKELREGVSSNSEKQADRVGAAIFLLDRILAEEYYDRAFLFHDKKWGVPELSTEELPNGNYKLIITRCNVHTDEDRIQERKEYRRCAVSLMYSQKQDVNALFSLLAKHIRTWWT